MEMHMEVPTSQVEMICNLQNVKQGFKSDFSDKELSTVIFENLDFTDALIAEHLGLTHVKNSKAEFVMRDPAAFRSFQAKIAPCALDALYES